ncbi:hypothetical protein GCM10020255_035430 [Rhodococcus baikonurensis]
MTDLHQLSAVELAGVIAAKQVSIPEVTRYFVDRATTSDDVGAFTTIAGEHAVALAEQAQRRLDERDAGPFRACSAFRRQSKTLTLLAAFARPSDRRSFATSCRTLTTRSSRRSEKVD